MLKSKRLWASALSLAIFLGAYLAPTTALAQDEPPAAAAIDAGAVPPDAMPAPAAAPVEEVAPAPAAEPAPAASPAPTAAKTALDNLSHELMNILVPAFVALIGGLVTFLLNWIRRKFKLTVSDQQIDAWAKLAERAAARGAEWARKKAKDLTEDEKVPGPEIMEVAANWAVEMGKTFKLPEIGREKLEGLIEAHLSTQRKE